MSSLLEVIVKVQGVPLHLVPAQNLINFPPFAPSPTCFHSENTGAHGWRGSGSLLPSPGWRFVETWRHTASLHACCHLWINGDLFFFEFGLPPGSLQSTVLCRESRFLLLRTWQGLERSPTCRPSGVLYISQTVHSNRLIWFQTALHPERSSFGFKKDICKTEKWKKRHRWINL